MKWLRHSFWVGRLVLGLPLFGALPGQAADPGHSHHPSAPATIPANRADEAAAPEAAPAFHFPLSSADCGPTDMWDLGMSMCMPIAQAGQPMKMIMFQANAFAVGIQQTGPRGQDRFASPNWFMVDAGMTAGDRHYLNLDFMGTFEKWTFPRAGYPLLMQIGEHQANGSPFLDSQHPHSSPIMGITLSDTIRLDSGGARDHVKLFFSPRGQSTEGPIAFMHRASGMANPDAPLGHHIAQDVGHITSTVIGASTQIGRTRLEVSTFHGTEPEPTKVDLPLGVPNSFAARLVHEFTPRMMAMISGAYVNEPEHDDPTLPFVARYSASFYTNHAVAPGWTLYNSLIAGLITKYDHASKLASFGEELWMVSPGASRFFGRVEILQRTPRQLGIVGATNENGGRWVTAATLGYTHAIHRFSGGELALGTSGTKDFLPRVYETAYSGDPWTGKVFVQLSAMKMWHFME